MNCVDCKFWDAKGFEKQYPDAGYGFFGFCKESLESREAMFYAPDFPHNEKFTNPTFLFYLRKLRLKSAINVIISDIIFYIKDKLVYKGLTRFHCYTDKEFGCIHFKQK